MSEETIAAILAALLPLALTALATWAERRTQEARRNTAVDTAYKRIQFLNIYLTTQQLILPPDHYQELKRSIGGEVERIFQELTIVLNNNERIARQSSEKNIVQRVFLLYRLHTTRAKVFRAIFYTLLIISTILSMLFTIGTMTDQDTNVFITMIGIGVIMLPFIVVLLLFRWLALRSELSEA